MLVIRGMGGGVTTTDSSRFGLRRLCKVLIMNMDTILLLGTLRSLRGRKRFS